MAYNKTIWENLPSTNTPINASNLNKLENEVELLDGGYIEESGSNANGSYIKYSDGTMICYKNISFSAVITATWGSIYDTGNQDIDLGNYAQAFIEVPRVSITMASANGCWVEGCTGRTTTSFGKIVLASATSKTATVYYDLIAIGRWK